MKTALVVDEDSDMRALAMALRPRTRLLAQLLLGTITTGARR